MAKMSPADKAAIKKRQNQLKEAFELRGTARFSKIMMWNQDELRKLLLNLGQQRPTKEPGNTMCREVMKLQGAKFHAYTGYAEIWDTVQKQLEAVDAAIALLFFSKTATVKEMQEASGLLQHYLDTSDDVLRHGFHLIHALTKKEALSLRQLVSAQCDSTIERQDRAYLAIESARVTISLTKLKEAIKKPFKCCAARAKRLCRKIKKKMKKAKKAKGKKKARRATN